MHGNTFDRLSRALVGAGSRRRLLGVLTGVPLAGLLGRPVSPTAVSAKRRKARGNHDQAPPDHGHRRRHPEPHERDPHAAACLPTGQRCPAKKPRGKHGKKLNCEQCCQGVSHTEADGKHYCGCQPNGGACTKATASSCCSGFCSGSTCQAAPCSAAIPCPPCQTCNSATGLCGPVADGTACNDGDACTTGETCQNGSCSGGSPVCMSGQHCVGGVCTCDATSCLTGCCDPSSHTCEGGTSTDACGSGGQPCLVCDGAGETCPNGTCLCASGIICSVSRCCPNATDVCDADDQCCTPDCTNKTCGDDGCGGPCGAGCSSGQICASNGTCARSCGSGCPGGGFCLCKSAQNGTGMVCVDGLVCGCFADCAQCAPGYICTENFFGGLCDDSPHLCCAPCGL